MFFLCIAMLIRQLPAQESRSTSEIKKGKGRGIGIARAKGYDYEWYELIIEAKILVLVAFRPFRQLTAALALLLVFSR